MFLTPKQLAKLSVFKALLFSVETLSIISLAKELTVSRQTLIRYLDELIADISRYFPEFELNVDINHGKIVTFNIEEETALYLITYLRLSYIEETKEFQLLHLLMQRKIKNVTSLARELHQSVSSVYLTLEKVTILLDHFDIKLNFSSHNRVSNFVFEEKKMRLFGYYFYWLTYGGIKRPLGWIENQWTQPVLGRSQEAVVAKLLPSKQNQLHYIGLIWYRRLILRQQPLQIEEPFKSILTIISQVHDVTQSHLQVPLGIDAMHIEDERLFINLFIRNLVGDIDTSRQKVQMFEELQDLDNPIIHLCTSLLKNLIQTFSLTLSKETEAFFFYHLVLFFVYVQYYDIKLPTSFFTDVTFKKQLPDDRLRGMIDPFLTDFFLTQPPEYSVKLNHFYFQLLVAQCSVYLDMVTQYPLKIAIQFSKNVMGEEIIKHRLRRVYAPQVLEFTANYQEADLVISESYEGSKKKKNYFFIDSLTDKEAWNRLFVYIQERVLKRNF